MIDDRTIEESNRIQIFVRDAMPDNWLAYADELKDSAEILWAENSNRLRLEIIQNSKSIIENKNTPSISRSYLLLAGFAIENVLKGIIIADDPSQINSGKLSSELKSHSLSKLASKINGMVFTKDEIKLLKMLEKIIPYWGRYPIPLEYNGVLPEVPVNKDNRKLFLKLHKRLGAFLHSKIRNGWDSKVGPKIIKLRNSYYGDKIYMEERFEE
ncbi:MAG: hypothetical protein ACYDA4_16485 [Ignavibacteriaceae bacterium]